ncbi:MAG: enoyl-CoA hydratase/isomerase family protein [Candidatus Aminicenantales bacterium]
METTNILFESRDSRAYLTINRPPMNILNIATMQEINSVLTSLRQNRDVKVLVIRGAGDRAFSAGVDVAEHTEETVEEMLRVFNEMFRNLDRLPQVTVAGAKGYALGGGCELALFCDLIFAADTLKIGQPEVKLSVIPPVALLILPRLIGLKKASELLLSGKTIDAAEAENIGLVNRVVPAEEFDTQLEAFIQPFAELSLVGLEFTKKGIRTGLEMPFPQALDRVEKMYLQDLMSTKDAHEGLKAFLEKRPASWKNT